MNGSGRARQRCAPSTAEYNNRGAGFNSLFCKKTEKSAFSCDSGCFSVQIVRHLIEQCVVAVLQRYGEGVAVGPEQKFCAAFKDKELCGIAALQRHRRDRAVLAVEKVNGVWVDRVLVIDEPLALRTIVDVAHRAGVVGNLGSCPVLRQVGEDDFFDDGRRVVVRAHVHDDMILVPFKEEVPCGGAGCLHAQERRDREREQDRRAGGDAAQARAVRPRCAQGMDGAQDAPLGFGADRGGVGVERVKGGDLFVEAALRRVADARVGIAVVFSVQQNTPPFHSGFSQGCGEGRCPPWRA